MRLFIVAAILIASLSSLLLSKAMADSFAPIIVPWMQEREGVREDTTRALRNPFPVNERPRKDRETPRHPAASAEAMVFDTPYERPRVMTKPSALENMYSNRIIDTLQQFGYDLFGVPSTETENHLNRMAISPMGAVQEDFILHSGDKLEVVFSGQRTDRKIYSVTPQGVLLIDDFPPIPVSGRTIGQVRLSVQMAARNLHNTDAYVALSEVTQIGVLIVGHVKRPGRQNLTVFHTALDALMEAGGVEKTGSLRQIKLVRHGRTRIIDLYGLLMHGATNMDFRLRDGDRIIVPPIGPTVAIAGEVKRPGIYEILPELAGMRHKPKETSQRLSLNDMLDFAGGVLAPGKNRFIKLDISNDGQEHVRETSKSDQSAFKPIFGDGAILMVSKGRDKRTGMVELTGHTRQPGLYAQAEIPTLSKLIDSNKVLGDDIYPLIGVIERFNPNTLARSLHGFPINLVLQKQFDQKLKDGDIVHLFSNEQIRSLEQEIEQPEEPISVGSRAPDIEEHLEERMIIDTVMRSFLMERYAFARGAVRAPGPYPVAKGTRLDHFLAVAGGITLEGNTSNIEITSGTNRNNRERIDFRETSPKSISISAGDAVRINQKFKKTQDKSVLIIGEVQHPGRYDLVPGDRLSDLLARAGGLTQQAYAEGAIFSRESERRAEEARFRAAARDLERSVAIAAEKDEDGPNITQLSMVQDLAAQLREIEAVGRITVESDPGILAAEPELDLLLESKDRLYIPKRPLTVRVRGEVLSPASLQFRTSKKPRDYIDEAGGFTYNADKDRTFVLYPDGSAQPLQVSSWNYKPVMIPPGSTIVIPHDPKPFSFVDSAKDISQILSNLAITGVFIDDIRDDD